MAARFVVAVALFALCHSSPIENIRDGRGFSIGKGYASGWGGDNQATAHVQGGVATATGNNRGSFGQTRDGLVNSQPGLASAIAQTNNDAEADQAAAIDLARAQGYYHPLPVAAPAVLTYNQNFVDPSTAESFATTYGGSAVSNARTGQGVASTNSMTHGQSRAGSKAHTNNYGIVPIAQVEPAVIAAKQVYYTPIPQRRSISWRFGTAYDIPAGYGSIKAATPVVYQPAPIAYEAIPAYGNAKVSAETEGDSSAQSSANNNFGNGQAKSTVTATGGSGKANADVYNGAYNTGLYRSASALGNGNGHTSSDVRGIGSAGSIADLTNTASIIKSSANTQQGSANANSHINNGYNGYYRTADGAPLGWGNTKTGAHTDGQGSADSSAQKLYSGASSVDSRAQSYGHGSANANSHSY